MLQVPRLDGDDYESIFQRARSRIPALTSEWTNFNAADPGEIVGPSYFIQGHSI